MSKYDNEDEVRRLFKVRQGKEVSLADLAACHRVVHSNPNPDPEILCLFGNLIDLSDEGDYEGIVPEDLYRQALRIDPGNPEALLDLAAIYWIIGELRDSKSTLLELFLKAPEFEAWTLLAKVLQEMGDNVNAEAVIRTARLIFPEADRVQEAFEEILNGEWKSDR